MLAVHYAKNDGQHADDMESSQTTRPVSPHLRVALAALGVAGAYVASVLVFGWSGVPILMGLLMFLSLIFGGVSALAGLTLKANRQRPRLRKHIGVLLAIVALLYLLTIGPGNYFRLIDLRARLAVAVTGGQDELQAWALGLLGKPPEGIEGDGGYGRVPKVYWSKQVHRLRPNSVTIAEVFENRQRGVCLNYAGGFFHWTIVAGPLYSRPDPALADPNSDNSWFYWADGLYDWQRG